MPSFATLTRTLGAGGLAYDPGTGILYLATGPLAPGQANNVYRVDPATAVATPVGATGENSLSGLAMDTSTNTLYAANRAGIPNLFTIDTATGAATRVGPAFALGRFMGGLAYDTTRDVLYGVTTNYELYAIDRAAGTATLLANPAPGLRQLDSLAYDPDLDLLWAINVDGTLFSYDPADGFLFRQRTADFAFRPRIDGLTYLGAPATAVPEPASLLLLAAALSATVALRRRA